MGGFFSTNTDIHALLATDPVDWSYVKSVIINNPNSLKEKTSRLYFNQMLPLHVALTKYKYEDRKLVEQAPLEVIKLLVEMYPQACQEKDLVQHIPLHIALAKGAPVEVVKLLLHVYPRGCQEKDFHGFTPLMWVNPYYTSMELVLTLLVNDLPLGSYHSYAWVNVLEKFHEDTAQVEYIVTQIFDRYYSDHPEICHQLANSKDKMGRTAISIVHEDIRKVMNRYLLFMGRFEMKKGPPEHTSDTCTVIIAHDHDNQLKKVALKFMQYRDGYQREIVSRDGINDEYVVPIDDHFDGDDCSSESAVFVSSLERLSSLKSYKYLLVMTASDRSLSAIILHEHICGSDWSKIKQILREVTICVGAVHSQGKIHGDIKPLNVMRLGNGQMCLIDMDATTVLNDVCGCKISSCYIPPEMVIVHDDNNHEISASLLASISYDMWSLGCLLYYLCSGETLFQASISDNLVDDASFHILSKWSTETKASKLSKITDSTARNLVSQLLHKDPTKRPDTSHVLSHPFLTGRVTGRLPCDDPNYDVFLSYRVSADLGLVEMLYDKLTALELTVFWDKLCLANGKNWQEGFATGLCDSGIFVPFISRAATKSRFERSLTEDDSIVDNVLLEHRLSLELATRDMITHIYPIYVGDKDDDDRKYLNYFCTDAAPRAPDIQVKILNEATIHHLDNLGLGSPLLPDITVKGIIEKISKNQAGFVEGSYNDIDAILSSLATNINDIVRSKRLASGSSSSSSTSSLSLVTIVQENQIYFKQKFGKEVFKLVSVGSYDEITSTIDFTLGENIGEK